MTTTVRTSFIIAIVSILLTLSGIFVSFEGRQVIQDGLTLNTVTLVLMIGSGGYLAGTLARRRKAPIIVHAVLGSVVVGAGLAALVILESLIDLRFVFANLTTPVADTLIFGQPTATGLAILMAISIGIGVLVAVGLAVPAREREAFLSAFALTVVIGLLEDQLQAVMALPDALAVTVAFAVGYALVRLNITRIKTASAVQSPYLRLLIGALPGAVIGLILALFAGSGALEEGGWLYEISIPPALLLFAQNGGLVAFMLLFAAIGAVGGLTAGSGRLFHNSMIFLVASLVIVGVLSAQRNMTVLAAIITFGLLAANFFLIPPVGKVRQTALDAQPRPARRQEMTLALVVALLLLVVVPGFAGQYITNVLNGVGLYIVMGIGLNIVVGYAGLLDLGYVAFFAIGAYTVGLLTTPSLLTCGGIAPDTLTPETVGAACSGIMTFWMAWPIAILVSALGGILLGIPVLRLRGDYLAIVTLGFGEIIRIIIKFDDFKPVFGAAQGIANIPRPVLDLTTFNPAWRFPLDGEIGIYYLVLISILITGFIGVRVVNTRLGRAWLAMRADEDVAQAMGVNLTRTKLLAFAIGAAFAGMGGALSGIRLYGAYPDSFTVFVSINVLSLIIIGGLASIPGVLVGALILVGLPEVLRELSDYRLLAFGVLLVVAMLLRPQGIIPAPLRRLTEGRTPRGSGASPVLSEEGVR